MGFLFGSYITTYVVAKINKLFELLDLFESMPFVLKPENGEYFYEYQRPEKRMGRDFYNDRIFPLETVEIQGFKTRHEKDVEEAIVHIGPYADEFARSMNALAVTVGTNMYFRNGAYQPGQEEGRKILSHELTHIAQYEDGAMTGNSDRKELEKEAEEAECREKHTVDEEITIRLNGHNYSFLRSRMKEYAHHVANELAKWVEEQRYHLTEREYLNLLCSYKDWIAGSN
jgi:hypothetical protein